MEPQAAPVGFTQAAPTHTQGESAVTTAFAPSVYLDSWMVRKRVIIP